ncbi:MAG: NTP transferase domain-containing protein [Bacteroidia bacterium]|nr:NTP transferase domain-containing protein [Bacteroidia bacterium]
MDAEAVILAGGFGSRLRSVVSDLPKPMADINGKPFLIFILDYLKHQNVNKAVLSVGYRSESIIDYFGEEFNGISLKYAVEEEPLGTGGGIRLATEQTDSKDIIILNGDTFFDVNLKEMLNFHNVCNADISIAVKEMFDFDRYGVVEYDDQSHITAFKEKEHRDQGMINGGVYIIKNSVFDSLALPEKFSFEKEVLESKNELIKLAYNKSATAYFIDIGIPEDYQKAQDELERITSR